MGATVVINENKLKKVCFDKELVPAETVEKYKSRIICGLHGGIANTPIVDHYSHTFCGECLNSYMEQCDICPVDKKHKLRKEKFNLLDLPLMQLIDELPCQCKNYKRGCQFQGTMKGYRDHVTVCPKDLISCKYSGCSTTLYREDEKVHFNECPFVELPCEYCNLEMQRKDLSKHYETCSLLPMPCENLKCGLPVRRKYMKTHLKDECQFTVIKCMYNECICEKERYIMEKEHIPTCDYRRFPCTFCATWIPFCFMSQHIENNCPDYVIPCPQNCEYQLKRKEIEGHILSTCMNTLINCPYQEYGCDQKFLRKFLNDHHGDNLHLHHTMVLKHVVFLKDTIEKMNISLLDMKHQQELMKKDISSAKCDYSSLKDTVTSNNLQSEKTITTLTTRLNALDNKFGMAINEINNKIDKKVNAYDNNNSKKIPYNKSNFISY